MKTIGFIGKPDITDQERLKLMTLGHVIGKSGRELVVVPARGSAEAVMVGVEAEKGRIRRITSGVFTTSAQSLVYADERLFTRLREAYPNISTTPGIHLMSSELELDMFLKNMMGLLTKFGIEWTE